MVTTTEMDGATGSQELRTSFAAILGGRRNPTTTCGMPLANASGKLLMQCKSSHLVSAVTYKIQNDSETFPGVVSHKDKSGSPGTFTLRLRTCCFYAQQVKGGKPANIITCTKRGEVYVMYYV